MKLSTLRFFAAVAGWVVASHAGWAQAFAPKKGAHVVLIGNTFVDRMQHYNHFEALLHQNFPDRQLVVRNMGWSADEPALMPRPLDFGDVHTHLTRQKADVILMGFGMNESFKGPAGLPQYEKDLTAFIRALQTRKYNGATAPQLVLISPIAHEALGGHYPDPTEHNRNLALYTEAMRKVAKRAGVRFIDLFAPSAAAMTGPKTAPLTINGIHLTGQGYRLAGRWMAAQLGLKVVSPADAPKLREVIDWKNEQFFYRWRAVNGEYIYGRRKAPFGIRSFPAEMKQLDEMVGTLDRLIWDMSRNPASAPRAYERALAVVDQRPDATDSDGHAHTHAGMGGTDTKPYPATTEQFVVQKGYTVNLFASEADFPLEKPVNMAFDARGRLWVALIPTYPHYLPGSPANDRIVILEDTNGDGRADKHTVFADKLYLPLSFEFWDGGLLVSAEPNLVFLKDTDGDDRADVREIILHGFGTEDSHHALHAFTYGQDGALYWHEGVFLHTQVETPYGPVRSVDGASYRFEPRTGRLSQYVAYHYNNPWGNVFDRWGVHLIGDASDGKNYYATPLTGQIDYPDQHAPIDMFTRTRVRVRPTAGIELVSSRHFPDSAQGNFLLNNTIGFQGIKQFRMRAEGSGFVGEETENLLQSTDPNFRPVDLKFGPDGALYVIDWFNPLIGHMQHSLRDPRRDHAHGRIWRITCAGRPLVEPPKLADQSVDQLLDNLKGYEDRLRYRTRAQLRAKPAGEVLPRLARWLDGLKPTEADYEHHRLEGLWLYQDFNAVQPDLLKQLLRATDHRARAAATRVLRHWQERVPEALDLLQVQINDESPRVRLEALMALSHAPSPRAVDVALQALNHPTDYYLDYALKETTKQWKPVWLASFAQNQDYLADQPAWAAYLLGMATLVDLNRSPNQEAGRVNIQPVFEVTQAQLQGLPQGEAVLRARLTRPDGPPADRRAALERLAARRGVTPAAYLLDAVRQAPANAELASLLVNGPASELATVRERLAQWLPSPDTLLQQTAYAALLRVDPSTWTGVGENPRAQTALLRSLSLLKDSVDRLALYPKVRALVEAEKTETGVKSAAIRAVTLLNPADAALVPLLSPYLDLRSPQLAPTVEALSGLDSRLFTASARPVTDRITALAGQITDDHRKQAWFDPLIALGKRVAKRLPKAESEKALFVLESTGTFQAAIAALPAKMRFDTDVMTLPAGRPVAIQFNNPDDMPHNFVIVQKGTVEKVGQAADAMAQQPDGFQRNFVPSLPEVLQATPLLNPGERRTLNWMTPAEPGEYEFVCTFPGHWGMMRGIIRVVRTTN